MADEKTPAELTPGIGPEVAAPAIPEHLAVQDHLEERRTHRKFRYWVGLILVGTLSLCTLVVVATMTYGYIVQDKSMEGSILQSAFQTISQIFSVLFGPSPTTP